MTTNRMSKFIEFIKDNRCELIIFVAFLSIYLATASRSVVLGDTGEFLTAAAVGGVVHDPGYPLYSLITHLIYLLPFGHNAYIVNVSSSIFAAFAILIVFRITFLLTKNIPSSLFAAIALGTYEFFWFYGLVAQVHIFHVFLVSLFFYFLLLALSGHNAKYLYLCGLVFGLGASHSQTIIFVIPSLLVVIYHLRKKLSLLFFPKFLLISSIGFLSYLYTVWAASGNPVMNWGGIHDIYSLFFVIFRGHYGAFNLTSYKADAPYIYSSLIYYIVSLVTTSWFVLIPASISVVLLAKKDLRYLVLLIGFFLMGPFFYFLMNQRMFSVTSRALVEQYIPYSFIFLCIFGGIGISILLKKYNIRSNAIVTICIILLFVLPFLNSLQKVRLDNNHLVDLTTKFMFSELPKDSIIITTGDDLSFPGMYLQNIEKQRPDIIIIQLAQLTDWYEKQLKARYPILNDYIKDTRFDFAKACSRLASANKLFLYPWYIDFDLLFQGKCENIPYGMITKVVPNGAVPPLVKIKELNDREISKYVEQINPVSYQKSSSRTRQELYDIAEQINARGVYYQKKGKIDWALSEYRLAVSISPDEGISMANEAAIHFYKEDYPKAIDLLEKSLLRSQLNPSSYYALGFAYGKNGEETKAYQSFKKYLDFNPTKNNQLDNIRAFVALYEKKARGDNMNSLNQ